MNLRTKVTNQRWVAKRTRKFTRKLLKIDFNAPTHSAIQYSDEGWKICVYLRENLISIKVNASHRNNHYNKSTQVCASHGQTETQVVHLRLLVSPFGQGFSVFSLNFSLTGKFWSCNSWDKTWNIFSCPYFDLVQWLSNPGIGKLLAKLSTSPLRVSIFALVSGLDSMCDRKSFMTSPSGSRKETKNK